MVIHLIGKQLHHTFLKGDDTGVIAQEVEALGLPVFQPQEKMVLKQFVMKN